MSESKHETNRVNHGPADPAGFSIPPGLATARQTIDDIGAALVHILAGCFHCAQHISHIKAPDELPPAGPAREARQVTHLWTLAEQSDLDPDFAQELPTFIIAEVTRHREDIKVEYGSGE